MTNVQTVEATVETQTVEVETKTVVIGYKESDLTRLALLDVAKEDMSVAQFMERIHTFKFNDPIQRAMVWSIDKKSELIVSVFEDVSIGEIKVEAYSKNKKRIRNVLDGKQRLTTLRDFIKNKFGLVEGSLVEVEDLEGETIFLDFSGAKFEDLPELFQNKIKSMMLSIKGYENLTQEKKQILFKRWNNGEALTPSQLRKAKLPLNVLAMLAALKEKDVFKAGFTESSLKRDNNHDMILKAMMVLESNNDTSISSAEVDKYITSLTEEKVNDFAAMVPFMEEVFSKVDVSYHKKGFGVAKTISFIWVVKHALDKKVSADKVAEWVAKFAVESTDLGYNAKSSTTAKEKNKERNNIALKHFNAFV